MTSKKVLAATADNTFGVNPRQPSLHPSAYEVRKPRGISSETGNNRREKIVVSEFPPIPTDEKPTFRTVRLAVLLRDRSTCRCCHRPGDKIMGYRFNAELDPDNFFMVCNSCHSLCTKVRARSVEDKINLVQDQLRLSG